MGWLTKKKRKEEEEGGEEEEEEPAAVSLCCVSPLHCFCLFNWNINGCVFNRQRQESALCFRSDADIWSEGCIFVSNHSHITTPPSLPGLFFFPFTRTSRLISARPSDSCVWISRGSSAPALLVHFPASHLAKSPSLLSSPAYLSDGMRSSCCCRLFPIVVSLPLSMGTLGLRQSCVAMAAGRVAELRTPGIWSLSLALPAIYSTSLSGFLLV